MSNAPLTQNVRPIPVAEWPKKPGERVLLWVVRPGIAGRWFAGQWSTAGNTWVYALFDEGETVTHVAPLPPAPEGAA